MLWENIHFVAKLFNVRLSMYYRSTLISLRFFGHLRLIGLLGLFGLLGLLGKKETHET